MGRGLPERLLASPLLRRIARARGYDAAALDAMLASVRAGEPAEVPLPPDLLPMLARIVGTGFLSFLVSGPQRDWVWPVFLERQLDPDDAGYLPRGHNPLYLNMAYRNWTGVGAPGVVEEAVVDPAGLVSPRAWGWSLDAWVRDPAGALHLPSRAYRTPGLALAQRLVDATPVVRTELALPDGTHRLVSTVCATAGPAGAAPTAVIAHAVEGPRAAEHEVIVALRPASPEGVSPVSELEVTERGFVVGGEAAVAFDRAALVRGASDARGGDVAHAIARGAHRAMPASARCRAGLATGFAAFAGAARVAASMRAGAPPAPPAEDAARVAVAGWRREAEATTRIHGVDEKTAALHAAATSSVLLLHDGEAITPGPLTYHHFWFRDAAYLVSALDRTGRHDLARQVLATYPRRQRRDGFFISQNGEWDANGQAIWTLWEHWLLTRDRELLAAVYPSIVAGARWIARKRRRGERDAGGLARGLLPAGLSAEHFGPNDYYYWDDFWCLRGLRDATAAAREMGDGARADEIAAEAAAFERAIERSLARANERLARMNPSGTALLPAGPLTGVNGAAIGSLCAGYPTAALAPDDPRLLATVDALRAISFHRGAFFQHIVHGGTNVYLSLQVAQCELRAGRPGHRAIYRRVLELASPTFTFPEAVHPRTGGGCMGDGHHGWAAAECLHYLHALFAHETGDRLDVLRGVDPDWLAAPDARVGIERYPTRFGPIDLTAERDGDALRVTLDARWHTPPAAVRVFSPRDPTRSVEIAPAAPNARIPF